MVKKLNLKETEWQFQIITLIFRNFDRLMNFQFLLALWER